MPRVRFSLFRVISRAASPHDCPAFSSRSGGSARHTSCSWLEKGHLRARALTFVQYLKHTDITSSTDCNRTAARTARATALSTPGRSGHASGEGGRYQTEMEDSHHAAPAAEEDKAADSEVAPRQEAAGLQSADATTADEASPGTGLTTAHDGRDPSSAPQPHGGTTIHAEVTGGHERGQHDDARSNTPTPTQTAPAGAGTGTATGSPADVPTGAPHFVAPSSYLRPLSRDLFARSPSRSGARPGGKRVQMITPVDREQIEGLVSRTRLSRRQLQ